MDTIFGQATVRGKSGVAVVRVSGPKAGDVAFAFGFILPAPRKAALRALLGGDGAVLDEALVLYFAEGESFTGEPTVELQLHGSVAIMAAVLDRLGHVPGYRLAEAGEFTRRALENDRLDLAQVEGLGDLIEAETEAQRKQAMRIFSGALGDLAEALRRDLLRAASLVEATIDFADEEVPEDVDDEVLALLDGVDARLEREIANSHIAERLRDGFEVAIIGPPNAGKSTLLNRIAGRDAAITSEIAGTTRDVIEVRMDLGGLPVTFLDTAGLRTSDDQIETLGVARAIDRARGADIRIMLGLDQDIDDTFPDQDNLVVASKDDDGTMDGVSGLTGAGVDRLLEQVSSALASKVDGASVASRQRHREAMLRAKAALDRARITLQAGSSAELAAEDMRDGIRALESLVGRIDVEAVLGEIFSSFCIGK